MDEWVKQRYKIHRVLLVTFFWIGAENSVVPPSLPYYLKELNTSNLPLQYGIIFCAYYLSSMLSALIVGRIADTTLRFRRIVLLIIAITIVGNAMYSIASNSYMILVGRLLGGSIDSMFAIVYGEYGRCYSNEEMRRHCGGLMTAYSLGFCIGPALNLFPPSFTLDLRVFTIRYTNAPGVMLLLSYAIIFIACFFILSDLSLEKEKIMSSVKQSNTKTDYTNMLTVKEKPVSEENLNNEEDRKGHDVEVCFRTGSLDLISIRGKDERARKTWWRVMLDFITRSDLIVLMYGQVIWSYDSTAGFILVPLVGATVLNLSSQTLLLIYIVSGVVMGATFIASTKFLSRFRTTNVAIAGFIINFVAYFCLFLTLFSRDLSFWIPALLFSLFSVLMFLAYWLNSVTLKALVSSRVTIENQSFSQGIFSIVEYLAAITVGVCTSVILNGVTLFCYVTIFLTLLAIVVFVLFYEKFEKPLEGIYEELP